MSEPSHQTVQLRHGSHPSPARGACVIELASMLAGERFSDHPQAVCPVLAGFLRSYNDLVPEEQLDELYPFAAVVVGSGASASVRRKRARRLLAWAGRPARRSLLLRVGPWDLTVLPAAKRAAELDREVRHVRVMELLEELVAMGRRSEVSTAPVVGEAQEPALSHAPQGCS